MSRPPYRSTRRLTRPERPTAEPSSDHSLAQPGTSRTGLASGVQTSSRHSTPSSTQQFKPSGGPGVAPMGRRTSFNASADSTSNSAADAVSSRADQSVVFFSMLRPKSTNTSPAGASPAGTGAPPPSFAGIPKPRMAGTLTGLPETMPKPPSPPSSPRQGRGRPSAPETAPAAPHPEKPAPAARPFIGAPGVDYPRNDPPSNTLPKQRQARAEQEAAVARAEKLGDLQTASRIRTEFDPAHDDFESLDDLTVALQRPPRGHQWGEDGDGNLVLLPDVLPSGQDFSDWLARVNADPVNVGIPGVEFLRDDPPSLSRPEWRSNFAAQDAAIARAEARGDDETAERIRWEFKPMHHRIGRTGIETPEDRAARPQQGAQTAQMDPESQTDALIRAFGKNGKGVRGNDQDDQLMTVQAGETDPTRLEVPWESYRENNVGERRNSIIPPETQGSEDAAPITLEEYRAIWPNTWDADYQLLDPEWEDFRQQLQRRGFSDEPPRDDAYLHFDGERVAFFQNGVVVMEWPAVSGAPGYQEPRFQYEEDRGPIPTGEYRMPINDIQAWGGLSDLQKMLSTSRIRRGQMPGGPAAWGQYRVDLFPLEGTDTRNRSGFFLHGGAAAGSIGCVDIGLNDATIMHEILHFLAENGWNQDLRLVVEYE